MTRRALAWLGALALLGIANSAMARSRVRPLFEPTDLEFDEPGVIDVDLQFGAVRSQGPWRVVVSDAEVDFGLLPNLELSVAASYSVEGPERGPYAFDHWVAEAIWPALKLGIIDSRSSEDASSAFALGAALGPKLPAGFGQHGVGAEGLMLVGVMHRSTHAVLNLGGFVDPRFGETRRATGLEAGLDLAEDMDARGRFALLAELSCVRSLSGQPLQLVASGGGAYSPTAWLDLSMVVLGGLSRGSDRYGLLFGVSPKFSAWK